MVDSVRSCVRSKFVPLSEASSEFGMTEGELIRAGIEGQIRVYFWLNEVRLAQKVKHDKEADTLVRLGEPQRARFYYIPVFRAQLAEVLSGRDVEASALTRADDDGADGEYWSPIWDRDESGAVIQMPKVTRDGLFVRRDDLQQGPESTDKGRARPARADAEPAQHQVEPEAERPGTTGRQSQIDDQREENASFSWRDRVREIADEIHLRDMRAGAWSSNSDIAARVAIEAMQRGVTGPRGQLTEGNILREALQGGRWKRPSGLTGK